MDQHPINSLTELFRKFPGIGPRQARRFVYYLLSVDQSYLDQLSEKIKNLKKEIKQCQHCGRYFNNGYNPKNYLCKICVDENRDKKYLMIVEKDADLEAIEKSGSYTGYYFILGGTIPILDQQPENHVRFVPLLEEIKKRQPAGLTEIIIALSITTEGDHTADWLAQKLAPLAQELKFKISFLGRGLSTGSELEYADADTIKNALTNRH